MSNSNRNNQKEAKDGDIESGLSEGSLFFKDHKRLIDYVLVFEKGQASRRLNIAAFQLADRKRNQNEEWRKNFLENLSKSGVDMEEEVTQISHNYEIHFIKLHAPWPVLCQYAEELNMRAPLEVHEAPTMNNTEIALKRLKIPNIMYQEVPLKPLDYYTCPFKVSKINKFLGSENKDTFFSHARRSRIVYEILSTMSFDSGRKKQIGIDSLIYHGAFSSAFPLHDGPYKTKKHSDPASNPRQILYQYWARWGCWYRYQPLDHIREYFGEKITIYFAWLGFYTVFLIPISIVGLLVFLYGIITMGNNQVAIETCRDPGTFLMCPLSEDNIGGHYWDLTEICGFAKLAYLFDHSGTVFYAVFVSLWAVTFLEYWKRKSSSLAYRWDCMGFQEEMERPRPEFAARAPSTRPNPVTGIEEPSFPPSIRNKRVAAGFAIVLLMIIVVLIFIIGVMIYRILVTIPLFQNKTLRSQAHSIANLSGAVVNLIIIMIMSKGYQKLAFHLTSWEMHRTQSEFDDNLTFKVFLFQFVNYYAAILYIAFIKGRFVGYPGNYTLFLGLRNEDCDAGGCLIELAQQLGVIMIGKQLINNILEITKPKMKALWQKRKAFTKKMNARWEEEYLMPTYAGLFDEYLEMVLQFGFITIFVAAFPLAPLFALLNNWIEIRLDAHKFVCETRRIVAERAENIGIWFDILKIITHLSVISNAFLIAFTSDFLPQLLYQYEYDWNLKGYVNFSLAHSPKGVLSQPCRYRGLRDENGNYKQFYWRLLALKFGFVIVFEHFVFFAARLIDIIIPDIPSSLDLKIKREIYLAKLALQDKNVL